MNETVLWIIVVCLTIAFASLAVIVLVLLRKCKQLKNEVAYWKKRHGIATAVAQTAMNDHH